MINFLKKRFFGKLSVKGEIIFLASLFTLLIMIIFSFFLGLTFSDALYKNARRTIQHANTDVIDYMNNYFTNIYEVLNVLSQNEEVINAVDNEQRKNKALNLYEMFSKANPSIDFLFSGYENGFLLINDYIPPEGYDPRNRPWYTHAREYMPEFVTTQPYQEANSKEWVIATSKALITSKGDFAGVITTEFNNKTIISLLELNHMFETQRSYILDKSGTVLCHPDESFIGFDTADIFESLDEEVGFFDYTYEERISWGYYEKMPLTGWTVVTAVDEQEIRHPVKSAQYMNALLTLLLSLALGFILYYTFYKRFAFPIKELQKNVNLILRGKEPERQAYRYSNHEITQIAKGIEQLTETSLNKKKNELSVIVESSTDAIIFIDEDQRISNYNTNFLHFWGIHADNLIHCDVSQLFEQMADSLKNPEDFQKKKKVILDSNETLKTTVTLKTGRIYEEYSCPVIQKGNLSGRLLTYHDITDQKVLEENIRKAQEAAEVANRAKSDFLANMSHEIRTPLSGVIGYTELLKETPLNDKQQQYVINAHKSARALFEIINDILDFSKIEAGRMDLECILTDIIQLTHDAVDMLSYKADKKNISLEVHIQPEIPRFAKTDPTRLKQVLVNLTSNAVKFSEKGKVTVGIQFEKLDDHRGIYHFQVKDTGIGIAPGQQDKLFKAFSQADSSTTRKFGGTGLGLVISNYIVEKMGGHISFESTKDQGSNFHFAIQTEYEYGTRKVEETIEKLTETLRLDGISPKIIIAEDMRINMMLVESILQNMIPKVDVIKAYDGHQAVEKTKETKPDLILMDVQMPVMNGLEASRAIRKFNVQIPIIALTAGVVKEEIEKCYASGMNGFLSKPMNNNELFNTLKEHLENNKNTINQGGMTTQNKLKKINGIDLQKAMEMFSGNEKLYLTLLKEFVAECKENLADIEDGLSAWDTQKARGAAHKLKGTASNIFVTQVYEGAKELELTLREMKSLSTESSQTEFIKVHKMFKALETAADEYIASVEKI